MLLAVDHMQTVVMIKAAFVSSDSQKASQPRLPPLRSLFVRGAAGLMAIMRYDLE
jgi:hypothetical protein